MTNTENIFHSACLLAREGNLDEARQLLTKAIETTPDDAYILPGPGIVSEKEGNFKDAEYHCAYATKLEPDCTAHRAVNRQQCARKRPPDIINLPHPDIPGSGGWSRGTASHAH